MSGAIDRYSAVETVSDIRCEYSVFGEEEQLAYEALTRAIKALRHLPPAESRWILCSEQLPEAVGRYLATTVVGLCKVTTMRFWTGQYWWQVESTQAVLDKDVLAWAELPEPC
jgi:hypothetical protein